MRRLLVPGSKVTSDEARKASRNSAKELRAVARIALRRPSGSGWLASTTAVIARVRPASVANSLQPEGRVRGFIREAPGVWLCNRECVGVGYLQCVGGGGVVYRIVEVAQAPHSL